MRRFHASTYVLLAFVTITSINSLTARAGQCADKRGHQKRKIEQLIRVLRDESLRSLEPQRVTEAIIQLGEMRAVEAVPDLTKLLEFKRSFSGEGGQQDDEPLSGRPITTAGRFPAVGSLFQIGKPALPALIKVIETEDGDSLASENAGATIFSILRGQPEKAVEYIRRAAAQAGSPLAEQRLLNSLNKLKP